jgi:23S rRNA pseudouridine955/2504/2580 synthase
MSQDKKIQVVFKTVDEFSQAQRLDNYLLKILKGVPKSHIYRLVRKGEVRVNKGRKKVDYKLEVGDIVRIPPVRMTQNPLSKPSNELKEILKSAILYEDKGLLVLNKPSGLAVHSGSGVSIGVIEALRAMFVTPVELVHRLDRATSGVLLIAKKRSVLKDLHSQLNEHQMEKRYTALLKGIWSKKRHTIDAPLYQHSRGVSVDVKGKEALSHFQPLKNFQQDEFEACLAEIIIETGRMHQIRAHAKYVGRSLAGDDKYGDKIFNSQVHFKGLRRLFLHAHQLTFTNPSSGEIQVVRAPLPSELEIFLSTL